MSGVYTSAHVSQAQRTYERLIASGVAVNAYHQVGDVVYFHTDRPASAPAQAAARRWPLRRLGCGIFLVASLAAPALFAAGALSHAVALAAFAVLFCAGLVWLLLHVRGNAVVSGLAGVAIFVCFLAAMVTVEESMGIDRATSIQRTNAIVGALGFNVTPVPGFALDSTAQPRPTCGTNTRDFGACEWGNVKAHLRAAGDAAQRLDDTPESLAALGEAAIMLVLLLVVIPVLWGLWRRSAQGGRP